MNEKILYFLEKAYLGFILFNYFKLFRCFYISYYYHLILSFIFIYMNYLSNNIKQYYFYWGWNRAWFTRSNILFNGINYSFTLENVKAKDRQTKEWIKYFHPLKLTIPQYNCRIGKILNNSYDISFGVDHMKYVMVQNQNVNCNGYISNTNTKYDNNYNNKLIKLTDDFLKYEHTDGLNYINFEIRKYFKLISIYFLKIFFIWGIGTGSMFPKTNTKILNNKKYDQFHLSGYGINKIFGLKLEIINWFVLIELKLGYINMPNIKTGASFYDKAKQYFYFISPNIVFGMNI